MTTEEATRRSRADSGAAGSASVEFVLAAMVVLPMALAIVEFSQLAVARHALNHGVFEAARAASVQERGEQALRRQLARAMMPLFAPPAPGDGTPTEAGGVEGVGRAAAEFLRPDLATLSITEIPADLPATQLGSAGGVLVVRVRYCRELLFPWHAGLWPASSGRPAFDLGCRARGRLPIESVAAVHVQATPAPQSSLP